MLIFTLLKNIKHLAFQRERKHVLHLHMCGGEVDSKLRETHFNTRWKQMWSLYLDSLKLLTSDDVETGHKVCCSNNIRVEASTSVACSV